MILLLTLESSRYSVVATAVSILAVAVPVWILAGTTYRVGDGTLTVSKPFRRRRVDLADITAVERWPYGSFPVEFHEDFALSSKRILIAHAESRVFVSPKEDQAFLAALGRQIDV